MKNIMKMALLMALIPGFSSLSLAYQCPSTSTQGNCSAATLSNTSPTRDEVQNAIGKCQKTYQKVAKSNILLECAWDYNNNVCYPSAYSCTLPAQTKN